MKRIINKFKTDESGAVTVDWVVLCAAIILLALAIITIFQTGSVNGVNNMWTSVDNELS